MKMAIQPITGCTPTYSGVHFSGRKHRDADYVSVPSDSTISKLKQVPLVVMIAMSPLNAANGVSAAPHVEETPITLVEPLETLPIEEAPEMYAAVSPGVQQKIESITRLRKDLIKSKDGTECVFGQYVTDKGDRLLVFHYAYSNKHFSSHLKGIVRMICSTGNYDDLRSHYMVYDVLDPKAKIQGTRICKINSEYAQYIERYARSKEGYGTIAVGNDMQFSEKFGDAIMQNAPKIKDEINMLKFKDTGEEVFMIPPSEPSRSR